MWQEPKTDHVSTGKFNIDDYNRIIGNLAVIRELIEELYVTFPMEDLGSEQPYGADIFADMINAIEQNLDAICEHAYPFEIGERKTHYTNQPAANWKDYNRIESACLVIYMNLLGQASGKRRLAFTLGGGRF